MLETESEVLSIGISVIMLNLGMYLGSPGYCNVLGIKKEKLITIYHQPRQALCILFLFHV